MKEPLIIIAGPTASGKTKTGIHLAKVFNGEVISGDSMQVYQKMNIGTAKVTEQEMEGIPHHLIDILPPSGNFSAADFKTHAEAAIKEIRKKNKLPIIVGGTGLYIQSLLYDYSFAASKEDSHFRAELEQLQKTEGEHYLYRLLKEQSPLSAEKIHPNNTRRIIRALEVLHVTGNPLEEVEEVRKESKYDYLIIGLTMERSLLYDRINQRVDEMIAKGLIEEVRNLFDDYGSSYPSMKAIGYKEFIPYLQNEQNLEEAVNALKQNSRRFAKRQLTWFRNKMPAEWFDMSADGEKIIIEIEKMTAGFLEPKENKT